MTLRLARRATAAMGAAALLALPGCSGGSTSSVADQGFISGDGTVTQLAVSKRTDPVEFRGTTLQGKPFDLRSLRGDVVVVNVWASWCAPCIAEAPGLQRVHAQTEAEGVRFIGINTEADQAAARAHERRFGVTYPSLAEDGGRVLLRLRGSLPPTATPSTLVLDRNGRVAARVIGRVDASTLQSLVDDARAEPVA
jgi:thiol-disulfide isomerase/thioredoxin